MDYKARFSEGLHASLKYFLYFLLWLALGTLMGAIGGAVGAFFSKVLVAVTEFRGENGFLIYLLPVAGLAIVGLYHLCGIVKAGTNAVFETVRDEKTVPMLLAPAVFAATALTHLFGGSAGREGAAIQMGGSIAALIGKLIPIGDRHRHILTMSGMAAMFSALFGTPVGACIFAVEVASTGRLYTAAFFPCIVSSAVGYEISCALGVIPESYSVGAVPELGVTGLWQTVVIGVFAALAGILFCCCMHGSHLLFKKLMPNRYIRVFIGGAVIVVLTLLIGTDYNGSGASLIEAVFEGHQPRPEAFLLKILFTAITMGCGYKGGEIVPTLCIGATLGATSAALLGMSPTFGAALGMTALFSGVTNCPVTSVILAAELFGSRGIVFYMLAAAVSYLLTGSYSLYSGQRVKYSRLDDTRI